MRNSEWYLGGTQEALVLDAIQSDPLKTRPVKRHGKYVPETAKCGTMCLARRGHIQFIEECNERSSFYNAELARDVRAALESISQESSLYNILACYANGDFVGVCLVHRRGKFVLWRQFNPITRTFSNESTVVQGRSCGVTESDVIRLSGYEPSDPVRIVRYRK